jgi:hypothetical protein
MKPQRPVTLLLVLLLALAVSACGNKSHEAEKSAEMSGEGVGQAQSEAETEGIYVETGGLKYQVQLSRVLNPGLVSDRDYLDSIPAESARLADDESWFAVFIRAENEGEERADLASRFEIKDTQENIYVPVRIGEPNPFAYRPASVEPGELMPNPNSPAGERAPNGAMLLFKIKQFSYDNRPLALVIQSPTGDGTATINLDV